jgi:hypothetical protein
MATDNVTTHRNVMRRTPLSSRHPAGVRFELIAVMENAD